MKILSWVRSVNVASAIWHVTSIDPNHPALPYQGLCFLLIEYYGLNIMLETSLDWDQTVWM